MTLAAATTVDRAELFIGGTWQRPASDRRIVVRSATTEEVIGSVPEASEVDVDRAISAARRAFEDPQGWSHWDPAARADVLDKIADEFDARSEDIIRAISQQNGMPITIARALESSYPPATLRFYADLVRKQPVEEERPGLFLRSTTVRRSPIGVVAGIVPWNVPQSLTMTKLAPALAAGNSIVLKPSPETVLDAFLLADAIEAAGVPEGVVSILPGGRELGAYIVSHPDIDKVAFTGSTNGGRAVAKACAELLRPVSLELGGKSAAIILDDADLDLQKIGQSFFTATLANNGQVCFLGTRILAPRRRYDEVVDILAALMQHSPLGDPLDDATLFGPMASKMQQEKVAGYIEIGKNEGGRVVVGGSGRPEGWDRGHFVRPTLFADVDNTARIAQEEIFGPVLTVIGYDDDADAIRMASDSDYGLGGSVWSSDEERALTVARAVETGTIGINGYIPELSAPFGGIKQSGYGKEFGAEGLTAYQQVKSIYHFA
ncbi:aldehyde dehydrogenase [Paenarthrobacter ureafaciens]|uniref:aldehyde dehydrogenase n=1 Tax=Paenarthrobacter ureafaciens TaxID=37931 RepID=UPI002DB5F7A9|nr:aldehyde dehydrogenase [Paenarthrobacter ureafaciens]MEC3853901.1 aldehyde dehydrogenase [Paenarthrobacter ureafaciens]